MKVLSKKVSRLVEKEQVTFSRAVWRRSALLAGPSSVAHFTMNTSALKVKT